VYLITDHKAVCPKCKNLLDVSVNTVGSYPGGAVSDTPPAYRTILSVKCIRGKHMQLVVPIRPVNRCVDDVEIVAPVRSCGEVSVHFDITDEQFFNMRRILTKQPWIFEACVMRCLQEKESGYCGTKS